MTGTECCQGATPKPHIYSYTSSTHPPPPPPSLTCNRFWRRCFFSSIIFLFFSSLTVEDRPSSSMLPSKSCSSSPHSDVSLSLRDSSTSTSDPLKELCGERKGGAREGPHHTGIDTSMFAALRHAPSPEPGPVKAKTLTIRAVDGAKNMEEWADSRGSYPRRNVSSESLRGTRSPEGGLLPAVDCVRGTSGVPKPRRMVASSATLAHMSSPSLLAGRKDYLHYFCTSPCVKDKHLPTITLSLYASSPSLPITSITTLSITPKQDYFIITQATAPLPSSHKTQDYNSTSRHSSPARKYRNRTSTTITTTIFAAPASLGKTRTKIKAEKAKEGRKN
ncbi:hypothetical protein E2C01_026768 [Portunus trituberculatus]|uniref:Uncharacterized protein n=1 Tax=Portunus trituberculatus TaxID=210409 RepID=A0A5B7EG71_PORTR|nr:hypothetical protein [Portunus trituberculatus]